MSETIFISLASYREPELRSTIDSAINNAQNPESLHFGVYSQVEDGEHPDLRDIKNLTEIVVPASEAKGPGFARSQVMKMFNGQDYFLQIDAHSLFAKNWDRDLITLYKKIQHETNNNKVIITFWAKPYRRDPENNEIIYEYEGNKSLIIPPHYTGIVRYNGAWCASRIEMSPEVEYHESAVVLGGFIFGQRDLVSEVPYDDQISWTGEEFMFTIRSYTRGWKIYSPYDICLYHNYERHKNPRVWNDISQWEELEKIGKKRMYNALTLKEKTIFGIASEQLYAEYQKKNNIDIYAESKSFLKDMK